MPLTMTPLSEDLLAPDVVKAVGHKAPAPARMMAARGMVPLSPPDLANAIYQLTFDHDDKIAAAARKQAGMLPDVILGPALEANLDPRVLHLFSQVTLDKQGLLQKILLNKATSSETLCDLAGKLQEGEIEMLAQNQHRLLGSPEIIEQLYFNPRARMSTVQRLLELAARNGIELKKIPHFKQTMAAIFGEAAGAAEADQPPMAPPPQQPAMVQDPSQPMAVPFENWEGSPEDALDQALGVDVSLDMDMGAVDLGEGDDFLDTVFNEALVGEDWEEDAFDGLDDLAAEDADAALSKLGALPVNARIRLATLGSAMHRTILIKDSNRMVALAAISSPAVSDTEAARYATNRSLSEDVIRYICTKREWQKNYTVKQNLAFNPKTPLAFSMRLLTHLRVPDLKQIAMSRNVPSALVQQAKRLVKVRSGR